METQAPITLTDLCRVVTTTGQQRHVESIKEANGLIYVVLAETYQEPKMFIPLFPWGKEN